MNSLKEKDFVTCRGESDEVFQIIGITGTGAFLNNAMGCHGWESLEKLTKVSETDFITIKEWRLRLK